MKEISRLEPIKDSSNEKPLKKRKRPIETELPTHSAASTTEAAQLQKLLFGLGKKQGRIFSYGNANLGEGSAQNGEDPSRPFEHRWENELSNKDSRHLDAINSLNIKLLRHHAHFNDGLKPVLAYREQFENNPQQINQETQQQALENLKAL